MNVHRVITIAGIIAGLILGAALAIATGLATAAGQPGSSPHCALVRIVQPAPAGTLWVRFCGTGAGGQSPLAPGVSGDGPLLVDGGDLTPADCRHTAPCVVLWPSSPAS